jgi:16S rRNA (guanine527-N7)-methyltransferase
VKHSEIEPEPVVAAQLCGAGIDRVRRYALDLGTHGELRGLIGPDEAHFSPPKFRPQEFLVAALLSRMWGVALGCPVSFLR